MNFLVRKQAQVQGFLPYGRQVIEEDDIAEVVAALKGDLLTTGPYVARFEESLAARTEARRAIVCANGTAALHMAAQALKLGAGTKVIVPSVTFLATASAPHMNGAEIIFADVDPETGLMRARDLEDAMKRAGSADALFNVHLNGQCGDLEEINAVARKHGLKIVDDACHALGTEYITDAGDIARMGANVFSDLTVFSFHPVKTIAMGEGGAVTTNDAAIAMRLMAARNHGMTRDAGSFQNRDDALDDEGAANPWYYEMQEPAFNWRANDIQCALGVSQLAKLDRFVARRRKLAARYDALLAPFAPAIKPIARTRHCLPAWHLYVVRIDFEKLGTTRAKLMRALSGEGIGTQVHYFPVHRQPYYAGMNPGLNLPGADLYYKQALSLPLSAAMDESDAERAIEALTRILELA